MNYLLLRKMMRKQKITQEQMAQAIGINRSTFSRKMNNELSRGFGVEEASGIGHVLGLTPSQMAEVFFGE